MDNFEYSIQISDRDWAEFNSTAEECDLMQVSLASEEELLLSDPELEDGTSRPKFIRVSLCPPREEHHTIQSTNTGLSAGDRAHYRQTGPSEDVLLSGSEDEEEFGSVTRFLCQWEALLHKEENPDPSVDIPVTSKAKMHYMAHPDTNTPLMHLVNQHVVDQRSTLDGLRNQQSTGEIKHNPAKSLLQGSHITCDEDEHTGFYTNECAPSVQPYFISGTGEGSMLQNETYEPLDCTQTEGLGHPSINGIGFPHSGVNLHPEVPNVEVDECVLSKVPTVSEPGKSMDLIGYPDKSGHKHLPTAPNGNGILQTKEILQELQNDSSHSDSISSFLCDSTRDNGHKGLDIDSGLQEATRARIHSSAVKQSIPSSLTDSVTILIPKTRNLASKNVSKDDKSVDKFSLDSQNVCLPTSPAPGSTVEQVPRNKGLSTPSRSAPRTHVALTTSEMYDFFLSDVSEMANMDSKHAQDEGIMYTPDMYEYFFLETKDEEGESKSRGKAHPKNQSSKELVLNLPGNTQGGAAAEDLCLPDAYEFFFADDTGHQSSEGNELSTPAFHVQTAAVASLRSFLPQGLCGVRKGFTVRGSRRRTGRDGQLMAMNQHNTTGEAAGSRALRLPAGTGDACLVFLAFASWAVKSSDLQSTEGWKTALLANIGAVSAIQYLRRNTRSHFSEFPPESEEGP